MYDRFRRKGPYAETGCCKSSHIAMGLLVVLLLVLIPNAYAGQNAGVQAATQPKLNIVIVEGDGAINKGLSII
jgi:hypothetical protein